MMAICCCSLAGTAACQHCYNNPNATGPFSNTIPSTGTNLFYQQLAELTPMKHGKNVSDTGFLCSVCSFGDFGGFHGYKPKYCPNCGAKMEEVEP